MLAGGVVGGIFGFVTSYTGENSIAAIGHGMNAFLLAVRDHTVLLECICGAICIMICEIHFGKMKRMGSQIQDAEDEEYHELQCHEVELIKKESEVKKCEIRGCTQRFASAGGCR